MPHFIKHRLTVIEIKIRSRSILGKIFNIQDGFFGYNLTKSVHTAKVITVFYS